MHQSLIPRINPSFPKCKFDGLDVFMVFLRFHPCQDCLNKEHHANALQHPLKACQHCGPGQESVSSPVGRPLSSAPAAP